MPAKTSKAAAPETARPPVRCFLNELEWRAVEAIAARIIPTTATPGAREAGAVSFIDRMLASHYANSQASYRDGLSRLDELCARRFGRAFQQLNEHQQDQILSALEAAAAPEWSEAARFFEMVRVHTIEGVLSDPKYGGNRNAVGWRGLL